MIHHRNLIGIAVCLLALIFTSCGLVPSTPPTPVIQTVVVLQTVVVTATPPPAPIAASKTVTPTVAAPSGPPEPSCAKSDCTKTGPAITQNLKGNVPAGQKIFVDNCQKCHGVQGKKGIDNPGSTDGAVPTLNPIDPAFNVKDRKAFAAEIDAFIEHGSTPDGPSPKNVMDSWGDKKLLSSQQIADVIAYVMSINP